MCRFSLQWPKRIVWGVQSGALSGNVRGTRPRPGAVERPPQLLTNPFPLPTFPSLIGTGDAPRLLLEFFRKSGITLPGDEEDPQALLKCIQDKDGGDGDSG